MGRVLLEYLQQGYSKLGYKHASSNKEPVERWTPARFSMLRDRSFMGPRPPGNFRPTPE